MKRAGRRPRARSPQSVGTGTGRLDRDCIAWLLAFLQRDIAGLPPRELLALRNQVFHYLHEEQLATLTDPTDDELYSLGPVPPRQPDRTSEQVIAAACQLITALQNELRAGLQALEAGAWHPFVHQGPAPRWSLERRGDGTIQRAYMGSWHTITLASAADLLGRWWSQLRRCEYESCRAWFLPNHGKRRHHSLRCATRARYQRFKPKRNYKNEYARRHDSTRTPVRQRSSRRRP